jgi:hypothetical protein
MISTVSDPSLPPPYSIPSPVISVIAIAVIVVSGTHFTLRFPLRFTVSFSDLRFPLPIFEPPPTSFKTSNACITAVIAEVLAQIFRTILGALVGAFSGCFEWCFGHDSYDAAEREKEYFLVHWARFSVKECFLVLWVRLASKREFPCASGTV